MARKKTLFSRSVHSLLNYLFLGAFIAFICVLGGQFNSVGLSPVFASTGSEQLRSKAQYLTVTGHEQLGLGKAESALKNWEQATEAYTQLGDTEGIAGSQINQSLALQALGQYRRACRILLTAIKLDYQDNLACKQPNETDVKSEQQLKFLQEAVGKLENSKVATVGLRNLGDVLRVIGNLNNSELVLKKSVEIAKLSNFFSEISAGLLSYGNTKQYLYNRTRNLYERTESSIDRINAINSAEESLRLYQEASPSPTATKLQSQLNSLSLLLELADWLGPELKRGNIKIKDQLARIQSQIQPQVTEILNNSVLFSNLPPIQSIYAKINLAISLGKLNLKDKLLVAIQYAKDALQQAKKLQNKRAEAYAYGVLGKLYEHEQINQLSLAESSTKKAVYLSQSIQANDIAYKWQYQLGQIYEKNGNTEEAIAVYKVAVHTLEGVRQDLLSINPDVQFSFRENVKPVYDDLIRLLLQSERNQDRLKQVTEVMGQLQFAEIQNFLQCSSLDSRTSLSKVNHQPDAAFYTIVLEGQKKIEVILSLYNNQSKLHQYHHYSVDLNEFQSTVKLVGSILQKRNFRPSDTSFTEITSYSQKLYRLLIAPAKSYLPKTGTLVFVLDSELQSIPMALLQDEDNHYLIEKYSITVSLGSFSQEPKYFPWQQSRVLIGGVSQGPSFKQEEPKFEDLSNIKLELDEVEKNTSKSEKLYNKDFTKARFQNKVNSSTFSVLHIATHGIFDSDPEKTVILAYDTRINIKQLDRLLRSKSESSRDTIELLVLSACQTATGDKRAGLGIAGVAVQAGARSTLASLWNVSDKSTALFMGEFYGGLNEHLTKAEALRKAQLAFLKNPDHKDYNNYTHPYYWAPFILVGSWL